MRPADADEMVEVLADRRLYRLVGGGPLDLDSLRAAYERQSVDHSLAGTGEWHYWNVRLRPSGAAIGIVHAAITGAGAVATIAWLIGVPWQGRGFAVESSPV